MRIKLAICLICLATFLVGCRSSKSEAATITAPDSSQTTTDASASVNALAVVTATAEPVTAAVASDAVNSAESSDLVASEVDQNVNDGNNGSADSTLATTATSDSDSAQEESLVASDAGGLMPQRISIPSIDLDTGVVELAWHPVQDDEGQIFSEWDVADQAAGWHKNSSLIEQGGNVVLSGHNNILGAVFRELDQLKRGDEAVLWSDNEEHRYLVDKVMIVPEKYATQEQREANAAWIGHFEDDRLTLVSCWPRDDNSHRIIVVAYADDSQASADN